MKNYGAKLFKEKWRLGKLFLLAKTDKYSAPQLAKIFQCEKKTIQGVLNNNAIKLKNLGLFKKKYFCNENFFVNLTAISAYWAGFIAADGCLWSKNGRGKSLFIGLKQSDIKHLEKFRKAIKSNAKISYIKSNNSVHIGLWSEDKIFDSLTKLGIEQNKSLRIKKVKITHRFMSHFIRGVFDGDGYFGGKKVTHIQFQIGGYKPLLEQIQEVLVKKCKVKRVKIYPLSYGTGTMASRLQYTGSQIFRILDFLYKNSIEETRLNRKYKKYLILKKKFLVLYRKNTILYKNPKKL